MFLFFAQFPPHQYLLAKLIKYLSKFGQFKNFLSHKQSTVIQVDPFREPFLKSVTMFAKFIHPTQPLLTQNLDIFTNSNKFCVLEVGNDVCNWRKVDHPPSADTPLRRQSFCWESATTQFGQNCTMKRRILSYRPVSDLFVLSKEKN